MIRTSLPVALVICILVPSALKAAVTPVLEDWSLIALMAADKPSAVLLADNVKEID